MKNLIFSTSLRTDSLNTKLSMAINRLLQKHENLKPQIINIKSLDIPIYDGDIETLGIPEGVNKLGNCISEADAIIISSPEYNGSIAAPFKNLIDWVSRLRPTPWKRKPILLTGASPGALGAIRSFPHNRVPLDVLGAFVYPNYFGLAKANEAFDESGDLKDEAIIKRLEELILDFEKFAKTFHH